MKRRKEKRKTLTIRRPTGSERSVVLVARHAAHLERPGPTRVVFFSRICLPRPSFILPLLQIVPRARCRCPLWLRARCFCLLPTLPLIAHLMSMDALQLKFNMAMAIVATNTRSPTVSRLGRRGTGWNGCGVARSTDDGSGKPDLRAATPYWWDLVCHGQIFR
jgi:hypothetical protein